MMSSLEVALTATVFWASTLAPSAMKAWVSLVSTLVLSTAPTEAAPAPPPPAAAETSTEALVAATATDWSGLWKVLSWFTCAAPIAADVSEETTLTDRMPFTAAAPAPPPAMATL